VDSRIGLEAPHEARLSPNRRGGKAMSGSTAKVMRVPTKAWFGDDEIDLHFPGSWDVIECRMAGPGFDGIMRYKVACRGPQGLVKHLRKTQLPIQNWHSLPN
jgi:hypothetical protein